MTKRKVFLLLIAGIVAIGTVFAARGLMGPQQDVATTPTIATTEILAAAHDLPTGTILKDTDMKWISWTADADTTQFYLKNKDDSSHLIGAVLRDGVRSGEPLLNGHVVQPHDHGFLAAVLGPGKRAMSVSLSPSSEVAGFVFPGDHVDVILTHSFSRKDNADLTERRVSETVLSDVRVLALDQKSDSMTTDPKVATLATLEVSPKQAEKLALAADIAGVAGQSSRGNLSLVLRSLAVESLENKSNPTAPIVSNSVMPKIDQSALTLPQSTTTWDSDVSPAYPGVNGDDGLVQRVHVMRGKEATDKNFERRR